MYNTFGITPSSLNYKTYQNLLLDIKHNINKIPNNIDLIVGIPRSGMIPAYMIGLMLSKQVCTLYEFLAEDFKNNTTVRVKFSSDIKNILVIDDSILSGNASKRTKDLIKNFGLDKKYNIKYMAIYYKDDSYKRFIDLALEKVPSPRIFQWNYLNHAFLQDAAFDIDGVLCVDPSKEENDDGEKYKTFLLNARPLFIPKYKIPYIITSRLKKYENETKAWLAKHNVQYDNLIMLSNYTALERKRLNLHAKFKAEQYLKLTDIRLFIESNRQQAQEISLLTKKLCFCATTDELFGKRI